MSDNMKINVGRDIKGDLIRGNKVITGDKSLYSGGDVNFDNSKLEFNMKNISGEVDNAINQFSNKGGNPNSASLKELLIQLKIAVEADTELSSEEKAEALGELEKLARAGSDPQDRAMQRLAKRTMVTLRAITEPLTEASKLATACKALLPTILDLF